MKPLTSINKNKLDKKTKLVHVDKFEPRFYQVDLINALEVDKFKNLIAIWPRRAGKDVAALNLVIRQAFLRVGTYYYLFPKYSQCRKAIWDSILITGEKFLSFIPDDLIESVNNTQMKIKFINGSILQFNGSDNIETLLGTNPVGIVYSEYASQNNPMAYSLMRPILAANNGWVLFISTPKGYNDFYFLYKNALKSKDWFTCLLTVDDTRHITAEALEKEKLEMSEELFLQEYFSSFEIANFGTYYANNLKMAYVEKRVGFVPHDPMHKVHTVCDLGWKSPSVFLFYQVIGSKINIINSFHKHNSQISELVSMLRSYEINNNYFYGSHFCPHDAVRHNQNDGNTRLGIFRNLGINMHVLKKSALVTGIEVVKHMFNRLFIDEEKCSTLLNAIQNYSRKWDPIGKCFSTKDNETWANDWADCLRYLCLSIKIIESNVGQIEDDEKRYQRVMYGKRKLPPMFEDKKY